MYGHVLAFNKIVMVFMCEMHRTGSLILVSTDFSHLLGNKLVLRPVAVQTHKAFINADINTQKS